MVFVRWYYLFSSWIFLLSATYPFHKQSTFPMNVGALIGCFEGILNQTTQSVGKYIYILALHLLPFLWIPYDFSSNAIQFGIVCAVAYLFFIFSMGENPVEIYTALLEEDQPTFLEFVQARFGIF
jgi:hypothetical protein